MFCLTLKILKHIVLAPKNKTFAIYFNDKPNIENIRQCLMGQPPSDNVLKLDRMTKKPVEPSAIEIDWSFL